MVMYIILASFVGVAVATMYASDKLVEQYIARAVRVSVEERYMLVLPGLSVVFLSGGWLWQDLYLHNQYLSGAVLLGAVYMAATLVTMYENWKLLDELPIMVVKN